MTRLVQKFGGTSIADIQLLKKAAEIAVAASRQGYEVATVVSAMGHTTDHLISLAEEITPGPSPRELDMLLVTGEQQSISLMTMAIQALGAKARSFTGRQAGIITEPEHGSAHIKEVRPEKVISCLEAGEIAIVAGFQGVSEDDEITTLGRGGSDTTAVALANAIGAERCDIYTDVRGVYTADPCLLSDARRLSSVSYEEMLELSQSGSQVLNSRSVKLAMDAHIPVRVRSTFDPDDTGTLITHRLITPEYPICGIACDMSSVLVTLKTRMHSPDDPAGGYAELFDELDKNGIKTELVNLTSREGELSQELAFTADKKAVNRIKAAIGYLSEKLGLPEVKIDNNLALLSVVGRSMATQPRVISAIFDILYNASIPVSMLAASDIKVGALVPAQHAIDAVKLIHNRFGLTKK